MQTRDEVEGLHNCREYIISSSIFKKLYSVVINRLIQPLGCNVIIIKLSVYLSVFLLDVNSLQHSCTLPRETFRLLPEWRRGGGEELKTVIALLVLTVAFSFMMCYFINVLSLN